MGPPDGERLRGVLRGRLAPNQHQPALIYDDAYFSRLQHEILPAMSSYADAGVWLSACGWSSCSVRLRSCLQMGLLRVAGYFPWRCTRRVLASVSRLGFRESYRRTAFLLSLSAPMYTLETWIGGQLSVIGFFRGGPVHFLLREALAGFGRSGFGVGDLQAFPDGDPAAMMLVGGCWRMLAGFVRQFGVADSGVGCHRRSERLPLVDRFG